MNSYYIYSPKKKNGNWILRVKRKSDNKRFQKSFDASKYSKSEVQNIAKQIEAQDLIQNKDDTKYNPFDYLSNNSNLMFGEAVDFFLEYYKTEVKNSTLQTYKNVFKYFTEEFGKDIYVKSITYEQLKKFIVKRAKKLTTANAYLTPFRKLYSFLNKKYDINYSPQFEQIGNKQKRKAQKHKTPEVISEDELWKLYEFGLNRFTKQNHITNMHCFVVYFYTGMRTEEIAWLKCRDINLEKETLTVGRNKPTKNYKTRDIWVPEQCHKQLKILMKGKAPDDYIIDHSREDGQGQMMRSNYWVWKEIMRLKFPEKPYFPPYNLRHSCGCWLIENKFSVVFVKNQLGHSNLQQILTYVKMTNIAFNKEIEDYKQRVN